MAGLLEPVLDPEQEFEERLERARQEEAKLPVMVDPDSRIVWTPQDGFQVDFLSCPIFELLGHGTRGGGKTDVLLTDFAQHVGRGYGAAWRGILFRETYPQLADVVAKSEKWFRQIFPGAVFNRSQANMHWRWPTGETLFFRHMARPEDYWNYHGHEYPWIGWEELTNWATDECYKLMFACCRSSNPKVPRKIRSTTNPYGIGHNWVMSRFQLQGQWWKTIIITDAKDIDGRPEPPRASLHSHIDENQILLKADPHYKTTITAAASNKAMAQAWSDGSWDLIAGGMFDDVWDPNRNCVPDFNVPPTWRIDRAFDWGSSKPFSVGWYAVSDGSDLLLKNGKVMSTVRGDLFRIGEWYGWTGRANEGKRMLAVDVAKGIVEREVLRGWRTPRGTRVFPGPADSSIYVVENGNCIANDMDKPVRLDGNQIYHGVTWVPSDKRPGSRKMGWEMTRKMIRNARAAQAGTVRERPGLFVVAAQCPQFLRTVLSLPRDPKDLDDADSAAEDHCLSGDTLVVTPNGPISIAEMPSQGTVLTPFGWKRYVNCGLKTRDAECVEVTLGGSVLICTPDHMLLGPGGWFASVDAVDEIGYRFSACECESCRQRSKSSTGSGSTCAGTTFSTGDGGCTRWCGLITTDLPRRALQSTTPTSTTGRRTRSKTSSCYPVQLTRDITGRCGPIFIPRMLTRCFAPPSGTDRKQARLGTESSIGRTARALSTVESRSSVSTVELSSADSRNALASVLERVRQQRVALRGLTTKIATAERAARLFASAGSTPTATVPGLARGSRVRSVHRRDVYCLDVPGVGAFVLANGLVVANCADEVRYRVRSVGTEVTGGRTVGMY